MQWSMTQCRAQVKISKKRGIILMSNKNCTCMSSDVLLWLGCRIPTSSHQSFRRRWLTWTNIWWEFIKQLTNKTHLTSLTLSSPVSASRRWQKSWESIGGKSLHESCQSIHRWVELCVVDCSFISIKYSTRIKMKQHHFSRFVHAGRAIRHRGDYACIVLCDHRYSRTGTLQKLPEWIRSSTRTHTSFGPAFASIRKVRCLKTRCKSTLLRILEWSRILCSSIQLCDVLMRQTVVNVTLVFSSCALCCNERMLSGWGCLLAVCSQSNHLFDSSTVFPGEASEAVALNRPEPVGCACWSTSCAFCIINVC